MKTFLFIDDNRINRDRKLYPMLEITFWQGIKKLFKVQTYYLHQTMGRPIIMRWKPNPTSVKQPNPTIGGDNE